jgi:galactitol-specific phosphotransferase system IIC component
MLPLTTAAVVAAKGNIFAGLWYPVIVAAVTLVIGTIFIREKKDQSGFHDV